MAYSTTPLTTQVLALPCMNVGLSLEAIGLRAVPVAAAVEYQVEVLPFGNIEANGVTATVIVELI